MKAPYVFNIQKFSLHDGPGIRTTVFFKGCPLRCPWCHNPESQRYEPEPMRGEDGGEEWIGQQYAIPALMKIIEADQIFYDQSGGGVTLSGGEVMTQDMDYIEALAHTLLRRGISLAVDTCGYAPRKNFDRILPYTDLFLYDVKCLDAAKHQAYTQKKNQLILDNLRYLSERGATIELRLMLIENENAAGDSAREMISWLQENAVRIQHVSLLPYHDFGREKYRKLQRECTQNFCKPTDAWMQSVQSIWTANGYETSIGG